jgi:hypothetical protein
MGTGSAFLGPANSWFYSFASAPYYAATGSVPLVATAGATWNITGVQLELGSNATPFERRQYGTELALCQRYYYKILPAVAGAILGSGIAQSTTTGGFVTQFPVTMRVAPSSLEQSGTATHYNLYTTSNIICSSVPTFSAATTYHAVTVGTVASGNTANIPQWITTNNVAGYLGWSAEL